MDLTNMKLQYKENKHYTTTIINTFLIRLTWLITFRWNNNNKGRKKNDEKLLTLRSDINKIMNLQWDKVWFKESNTNKPKNILNTQWSEENQQQKNTICFPFNVYSAEMIIIVQFIDGINLQCDGLYSGFIFV